MTSAPVTGPAAAPGQPPGPGDPPLAGIRVLDLSRVIAGPLCGRILADLGADVVKVEPPDGDRYRVPGPWVDGISVHFAQVNAGKRNVCIDLKAPGGTDLVADLAGACDVLVENFRPGVLERFGLGAQALLARNPRLVYCSISGWGQEGPWRSRPAYAPVVHAETGVLDMTGRLRGREPEPTVRSEADVAAAVMASNAVLAALFRRARTGVGQHLDIALAEAYLYVNEWAAAELQRHTGPNIWQIWANPVFRVADGTAVTTSGDPVTEFTRWVRLLGGPQELGDDPRFATPQASEENHAAGLAVLRELVERVPDFPTLERLLAGARTLVAEIRSVADLGETEWADDRGAVTEVAPGLRVPTAPWRAAGSPIGVAGQAARRGAHNQEVLADLLGLPAERVAELTESGVLRSA